MKKKSQLNQKIKAVTLQTLLVGIDIAKEKQWARFVDCRGVECGKAMYFRNDRTGFESILAKIRQISKEIKFADTIVGMKPTGHYWKALANYLMKQERILVVLVNPYHTKKVKELDDNSQTKSDKKDALTIARLVKDGRYSEVYLPHDIYADLRVLTTARNSVNRQKNAVENTILAIMDESFPEFTEVFKHPFKGKAAMQVLKSCPFPKYILELGTAGVLAEIKKAVKRTVGRKRAQLLVDTAQVSVGVDYGVDAARCKLRLLLESLELANQQLSQIEAEMTNALEGTGIAEYLLSIKGIVILEGAGHELPQICHSHHAGGGHAHVKTAIVCNADHGVQFQHETGVHSGRDGHTLLVLHNEQQALLGVRVPLRVQFGIYAHLVQSVLLHDLRVAHLDLDGLALRVVLLTQQVKLLPPLHKIRLLGQERRVNCSRAAVCAGDPDKPAGHPLVKHFHAVIGNCGVFPMCHKF